MTKHALILTVALLFPGTGMAQFVSGIKVEPAQIKPGETAKITVNFDVSGAINCGLRLHFGDGTTQDFKINQKKDVPLVVGRAYAKAGTFTVKAEPKTVGMAVKCGGKNQETALSVLAPPPPPAVAETRPGAPASAKAAGATGPQCPEPWNLDRKSVSKKTGAFTCTAKAGTKPPEPKLGCPGDLTYFENAKKGRVGCRP